jgi:L-lactate dehydrogenase
MNYAGIADLRIEDAVKEPVRPDVGHRGGGVAVIGAGNVGAAVASSLVLLGAGDRLVLYDRRLARAQGEAWDIADGTPMHRSAEIVATDDWHDIREVDAVVVTVGTLMRPGHSRLEERNEDLIRSAIEHLDVVVPDAVVVIVTNPVDVMTRVAQEASARPWHRILGTGTVLDTARLRHGLSGRLGVDATNTHVHVIGEHGDSSFPAWSSATIGPFPLAAFPLREGEDLEELKADCAVRTRRRGLDVLARKGYTSAGIAVAVSRIVESVLRDEGRIYTVSTRALAEYGIGEQAVLSLPCVIGRDGVTRRLPLALDREERRQLQRAAGILDAAYRDHSTVAPHA